jgi:hypothetical protein
VLQAKDLFAGGQSKLAKKLKEVGFDIGTLIIEYTITSSNK